MLTKSAWFQNRFSVATVAAVLLLASLIQADQLETNLNSRLTGGDLLTASTFLGGSGRDGRLEVPVAVDADGNVFVAGRTSSLDIPYTIGAYDTVYNGGANDVIVAKLSADLSTLLACTYVGGSGDDGDWQCLGRNCRGILQKLKE